MADREFASLANEVDLYAKQIHKTAQTGKLADAEITSLSIFEYFKTRPDIPQLKDPKGLNMNAAIREWKKFGLTTIQELDSLLTNDLVNKLNTVAPSSNYMGFARRSMMYSDIERFFSKVYDNQFHGIHVSTFKLLTEKYGAEEVNSILKKNSLPINNPIAKSPKPSAKKTS